MFISGLVPIKGILGPWHLLWFSFPHLSYSVPLSGPLPLLSSWQGCAVSSIACFCHRDNLSLCRPKGNGANWHLWECATKSTLLPSSRFTQIVCHSNERPANTVYMGFPRVSMLGGKSSLLHISDQSEILALWPYSHDLKPTLYYFQNQSKNKFLSLFRVKDWVIAHACQ